MHKEQVTKGRAGNKAAQHISGQRTARRQQSGAVEAVLLKPSELAGQAGSGGDVLVGDNHIVRGSVFVIGGAPGVGKSRATVALAVAGATAADWFGLKVHRRFRTLIVQAEKGRNRLRDEFAEFDASALDEFVRVSLPFSFDLPKLTAAIRAWAASFKPDVVLLDPWNACAREEKARDYLDTFDAIRTALPRGTDAPALGIVAHTRKPHGTESNAARGLLNLLAGSYVLTSVPHTVWVLRAASDEPDAARVIFTCAKNVDGELGAPSVWRFGNGRFTRLKLSGGNCEITASDVSRVFARGRRVTRKEAVEVLMDSVGCRRSEAYDALRTDSEQRFKELLERNGLLRWESAAAVKD